MKLATFELGSSHRVGAVEGDEVVDLTQLAQSNNRKEDFTSMLSVIRGGPEVLEAARQLVAQAGSEVRRPLEDVTLKAPIPRTPKNVFCVGLNYQDHIDEGASRRGEKRPSQEVPVFFTKSPTGIVGPGSEVPYPSATEKLDYEVEVGVVMAGPVSDVTADEALDHVFGYTVVNDLTARDLQQRHQQWFKGKGLDNLCPMGPWIVTADEVGDPHSLEIESRVNGEVRQHSNTSHMIFDIPKIISSLSAGLTLEPGDVIATGTCAGVGMGFDPPRLLSPGDVVEAEVSAVGVLRTTIGPRA